LSRNYLQSLFSDEINDDTYLVFINSILDKVFDFTPDDVICCAIGSDDKNQETKMHQVFGTKIIQAQHKWVLSDEIIWVKSRKDYFTNQSERMMIDFEETPFSQIWVLSKEGTIPSREDFLKSSHLPEYQKSEIVDSIWFVQPSKEPHSIPKEILTRIILSYSNPNDLIWDPLAGVCLTAKVCNFFNRNFLCFTNNESNLQIGENALREK
jgi:DNA modification methylase